MIACLFGTSLHLWSCWIPGAPHAVPSFVIPVIILVYPGSLSLAWSPELSALSFYCFEFVAVNSVRFVTSYDEIHFMQNLVLPSHYFFHLVIRRHWFQSFNCFGRHLASWVPVTWKWDFEYASPLSRCLPLAFCLYATDTTKLHLIHSFHSTCFSCLVTFHFFHQFLNTFCAGIPFSHLWIWRIFGPF